MSLNMNLQRAVAGFGILLAVLVLGYLALRPVHLRWGANDDEVSQAMPGDLNGRRWTRAVTVNAPPEQIWPWLLQWGQGRGGWYSYDWLENLLGFDIHTADRILPEHQHLAVGDPICLARGVCLSQVSLIEPNRWLSWQSVDEAGQPVWTFTLGLFPIDAGHTRLVIRESFSGTAMPAFALAILEIPDVVMEQKALDTVKNRAEGIGPSDVVTLVEIGAWLVAFAIGVFAAVRFVTRPGWRGPLAVGVAAALVLLALTFLYPPLWVRALLDLGLLAGLAASLGRLPKLT